jgi:hypothetical protein
MAAKRVILFFTFLLLTFSLSTTQVKGQASVAAVNGFSSAPNVVSYSISASTFWGATVTSGSANGFILVWDLAAVPSPGTGMTPKMCYAATANSTVGVILPGNVPINFKNRISIAYSVGANCSIYTADSAQDFYFIEAQ